MRERDGDEDWSTGGGEPEVRWEAGDMLLSRRVGEDSLDVYTISRCGTGQGCQHLQSSSLPSLRLAGTLPCCITESCSSCIFTCRHLPYSHPAG